MTPGAEIEPGPHWWKASALTTRPTLAMCVFAPRLSHDMFCYNTPPFLSSALPEPSGFYPLTSATAANDSSLYENPSGVIKNAFPFLGVCGENGGSYNFTGSRSHPSYIKLPKSEFLDTR